MGNSSPILILFRMGMAGSGIKSEKMGQERGMFTSGQDKSLRTNKVHQENIRYLRKMTERRLLHTLSKNIVDWLWDTIRHGDKIKSHR